MRKISLCVTVAFLCCGHLSSFAQTSLQNDISSRGQGSFDSPSDLDGSGLAFGPASENEIPDPFTFLDGSEGKIPPLPTVTESAGQKPALEIQPQAEIDTSSDPKSLPVKRSTEAASIVDTMADHGTIASIPNAALEPVDWCYGQMQAPNHIADYLMRQECVEGLWDRYPAQRAAECACMWKHLTAKKKCRCGHGCNSGCSNGYVNRYTQGSCDNCTHCAATANAQAMQQAEQMARTDAATVR